MASTTLKLFNEGSLETPFLSEDYQAANIIHVKGTSKTTARSFSINGTDLTGSNGTTRGFLLAVLNTNLTVSSVEVFDIFGNAFSIANMVTALQSVPAGRIFLFISQGAINITAQLNTAMTDLGSACWAALAENMRVTQFKEVPYAAIGVGGIGFTHEGYTDGLEGRETVELYAVFDAISDLKPLGYDGPLSVSNPKPKLSPRAFGVGELIEDGALTNKHEMGATVMRVKEVREV